MPDAFGFDHLPQWGTVYHRCIECEWPGQLAIVSEGERRKHHQRHEREHREQAELRRRNNLALARRLRRQKERENARAYGVDE